MSYILDALKKSEQARGTRKTRDLFEEPFEEALIDWQPEEKRRRWPLYVALFLLLNAGIFLFWLRPRQPSRPSLHQAAPARESLPAKLPARANPQAGPAPAIAPLAQRSEKHQPAAGAPAGKKEPAPRPAAPRPAAEASAIPAANAGTAHETVPDRIAGKKTPPASREAPRTLKAEPERAAAHLPPRARSESPKAEAAARPHASGPAAKREAAARRKLKRALRTAKLKIARKSRPAPRRERPAPQAAGNEIISDIRALAKTGAPAARPAAPRVPRLRQLAPRIRDSIPRISVSMLIYSKNPKDRWININGSKRREGEEISAGLRLDRITPDGAIFSYHGHRFYKGVLGD